MILEDDLAYLDALAAEVEPKLDDAPSVKAVITTFRFQVDTAKKILGQARESGNPEHRDRLVESVRIQRSRLARLLLTAEIKPLRKKIKVEQRARLEKMEADA